MFSHGGKLPAIPPPCMIGGVISMTDNPQPYTMLLRNRRQISHQSLTNYRSDSQIGKSSRSLLHLISSTSASSDCSTAWRKFRFVAVKLRYLQVCVCQCALPVRDAASRLSSILVSSRRQIHAREKARCPATSSVQC